MKSWLAIGVGSILAAPAAAAALEKPSPPPSETAAKLPSVKFRLVRDPIADPKPVHQRGMIVQTGIAPNAVIGLGLFKTSPKKLGSGEWRTDSRSGGSRKAAVRIVFDF